VLPGVAHHLLVQGFEISGFETDRKQVSSWVDLFLFLERRRLTQVNELHLEGSGLKPVGGRVKSESVLVDGNPQLLDQALHC
jgi:hypothetical protein